MKIQTLFSLAAVGIAFASPTHNLEERDTLAYTKCITGGIEKWVNDACATRPDDCTLREEWTSCLAETVNQVPNLVTFLYLGEHLRAQYFKCYQRLQPYSVESVPGLYDSLAKNANVIYKDCISLAPPV
ncbi:hypothetical protein BDV34DRAFT_192501 [Aspergillus parasiticus]|uniref:Uncharacterized protein n=1 Tax=Aspergillus parasiticus TaxID=5067 RepID=A0A5N6DQ36_ASPPA|nr:hypothetical protein BDV34DRAFT_192501 [Aspergillus parasiticus]